MPCNAQLDFCVVHFYYFYVSSYPYVGRKALKCPLYSSLSVGVHGRKGIFLKWPKWGLQDRVHGIL